jgi:hypothetical protein
MQGTGYKNNVPVRGERSGILRGLEKKKWYYKQERDGMVDWKVSLFSGIEVFDLS